MKTLINFKTLTDWLNPARKREADSHVCVRAAAGLKYHITPGKTYRKSDFPPGAFLDQTRNGNLVLIDPDVT